jgi:hypothetical protein
MCIFRAKSNKRKSAHSLGGGEEEEEKLRIVYYA